MMWAQDTRASIGEMLANKKRAQQKAALLKMPAHDAHARRGIGLCSRTAPLVALDLGSHVVDFL